jgi:hypothetical protein
MTDRTDDRPVDTPDDGLNTDRDEALEGDRPSGWAGVPDALDENESSLDDETPGSQGEIESGSEGDFGAEGRPS